MLTDEKKYRMYDEIIGEVSLTTKKLNEYGYNSRDINELIENGFIERTQRGLYLFKQADEIYYYGMKLLRAGERNKANLCFEKCYEINPNNLSNCFRVFFKSIMIGDYDKAIELLNRLYKSDNTSYRADYNYYYYLLNILIDLPEKQKKYIRELKPVDIMALETDKRYADITFENDIRKAVMSGKYSYALKLIKENNDSSSRIMIQRTIAQALLYSVSVCEEEDKIYVMDLVKNKKYAEVTEFLLKKNERCNLNLYNKAVLDLTKMIIKIKQSGVVPKISPVKKDDVFLAINSHAYSLALKLCINHNKKYNCDDSTSIIYILLSDICKLIEETNEKNKNQDSFEMIVTLLMKGNLDDTFKMLREFLDKGNNVRYESLIVDLIRIGTIERDIAFTKAMRTLTMIYMGNYSFDITKYIQEFYLTLSQNKKEITKIYLHIIKTYGNGIVDTKELEKIINDKLDETTEEPILSNKPTNVDKEKVFINNECDKLSDDKLLVLIGPLTVERTKILIPIVEDISSVKYFVVGKEDQLYIVLRKEKKYTKFDASETSKHAKQAYWSGHYDECINLFNNFLQLKRPNSYVFAMIGLSYMKSGKKKDAIDYLVVANELAKEEKKFDLDYTDLIFRLKNSQNNGKSFVDDRFFQKTYVKFQEKDFSDDGYYGIENFDQIDNLVVETGIDVESACRQFRMNDEQINIVRLIYAREYYTQKYFEKGDEFFKSVELSNNKTELIIKLLNDIRSKRKFYANRIAGKTRKVSLATQSKPKDNNSN